MLQGNNTEFAMAVDENLHKKESIVAKDSVELSTLKTTVAEGAKQTNECQKNQARRRQW